MKSKISNFMKNIDIENIGLQLFTTIIYTIISTVFIIYLNSFNKKILGKNAFEIMAYDNGKAWYFLVGATLLIFACSLLIYFFWKSRYNLETLEEQIVILLLFIIVGLIGILIICYINNPILRAALTCILVGAGIFSSRN